MAFTLKNPRSLNPENITSHPTIADLLMKEGITINSVRSADAKSNEIQVEKTVDKTRKAVQVTVTQDEKKVVITFRKQMVGWSIELEDPTTSS